jgi:hypothetical protein
MDRFRPVEKLLMFLNFNVASLILYWNLRFRCEKDMAKQCKAAFFCKLTKGILISWLIIQSRTILTNTKQLPFGYLQNTIGMLLVNLSNTIGMLLVNSSNLQNTHHAVPIIFKSNATCSSSGTRGMFWLSHQ